MPHFRGEAVNFYGKPFRCLGVALNPDGVALLWGTTPLRTSPMDDIPAPKSKPRLRRPERHQALMICESLDQRVDADHPVRTVWAFVERLDLAPLLDRIKAVRGGGSWRLGVSRDHGSQPGRKSTQRTQKCRKTQGKRHERRQHEGRSGAE